MVALNEAQQKELYDKIDDMETYLRDLRGLCHCLLAMGRSEGKLSCEAINAMGSVMFNITDHLDAERHAAFRLVGGDRDEAVGSET